jgi:hypothetical protein
MAALLSSFLKDFHESFLIALILLTLIQKVWTELPLLKMKTNEKFSSTDVDFSLVAALYHPLFIAVENRAVSIIGMKLYCTVVLFTPATFICVYCNMITN